MLGLRWEDLDLNAGTATITPVRRRQRHKGAYLSAHEATALKGPIGLHPDTVAFFAAADRSRQSTAEDGRWVAGARGRFTTGWYSPGLNGTAIHPDVLTRTIRRMSIAAGLPALTPHGLRHAFASAALSARVPVEVVAARLGNTARVVQEVYAHVIPADDAAAQLVRALYRKTKEL